MVTGPLSRAVTVAGLLLGLAPPVAAQRVPVLRQVKVPHPYYFREMYLPQVTGGPTGAAWSPDGRELVYSLGGSLWRQATGATSARQLTDGPGHDHQPDWSPDGRFVAYVSDRDDALELRLLDLRDGSSRPLTSNGAVNVEPRFSPDGRRLAFVSTLHEGRFHVFVMDVDGERAGRPVRVSEDRDSGLPRYYYGRHDQSLSPAWSPDGRELLVVSNRGRIWGSGGFWRLPLDPGAAPRDVRYEETTWRARPDWSKDGRRVVYASYLGRQWHQLWLMTPEGGDVFPLTYGDFDATSPRFSPDGRRVAYVSNEGGPTSLWVIELPGGARTRVLARERQYLAPRGRLVVRTLGPDGRQTPARLSITGPDGRAYAPDDAWRHADDAFDRRERRFPYEYFHAAGAASLDVPAGELTLHVAKGLEFRPQTRRVTVAPGAEARVDLRLERLDDLPARGWWSGDVHVHMNYGGAYRNTPRRLVLQAQAEDVHVVENLIVNKEQRVPDVDLFDGGRLDPASTADTLLVHAQEFHTSLWGHTGLLGLTRHLLAPFYAAYANTAAASAYPHNAAVADLARAQGALVGYVHPYDSDPDPTDETRALTHELPVDAALGKVDYYEALGFVDDLWATQRVWYRLLDCGLRLPAAGGTDAMANFASLRGPVGLNRTYVKSGRLEHGAWLAALRAGRTFATNGPLLEFTLDGRGPGDALALPGPRAVEARVRLTSIVPVDHLQVVGLGGEVVAEVPLGHEGTQADARLSLAVARSGWYLLRAFARQARFPVLDLHPLATTSPVWVEVAGAPVTSRASSEFFLAWIARLEAAARAHASWNDAAEREAVLRDFAAARRVYRACGSEAGAP